MPREETMGYYSRFQESLLVRKHVAWLLLTCFLAGAALGAWTASKIIVPMYWKDVRKLTSQLENHKGSIVVISPEIAAICNWYPDFTRGDYDYTGIITGKKNRGYDPRQVEECSEATVVEGR